MYQGSPTTNYGTQTNLQVDGDAGIAQISYIRFTVSGITGPIQSVKLRVFCTTNGTVNGPAAYLAGNNWIESGVGGITWNTQPPILSGALDNKGAIGTNAWVEYDVTALVTGDGTYTFALIADGNDGEGDDQGSDQLTVCRRAKVALEYDGRGHQPHAQDSAQEQVP